MSNDAVDHPRHYTQGRIETIECIESMTTGLVGIEAVCTGNALKYLSRWKHKNGVQDLEKAIWYIRYLVDHIQRNPQQLELPLE